MNMGSHVFQKSFKVLNPKRQYIYRQNIADHRLISYSISKFSFTKISK